jgi:hypothetical protein
VAARLERSPYRPMPDLDAASNHREMVVRLNLKGSNHRGWALTVPHPLHRHQPDGLQRPMIKTPPISSHAVLISARDAKYNTNVGLLSD